MGYAEHWWHPQLRSTLYICPVDGVLVSWLYPRMIGRQQCGAQDLAGMRLKELGLEVMGTIHMKVARVRGKLALMDVYNRPLPERWIEDQSSHGTFKSSHHQSQPPRIQYSHLIDLRVRTDFSNHGQVHAQEARRCGGCCVASNRYRSLRRLWWRSLWVSASPVPGHETRREPSIAQCEQLCRSLTACGLQFQSQGLRAACFDLRHCFVEV